MPAITPAISRAFVDTVRLPRAPRRPGRMGIGPEQPRVDLEKEGAQALVVGSGLIAAAGKVPVQAREDLVNCTLFAQLAATSAAGEQAAVADWYGAYFRALTVLGWAQSDTRAEAYEFSGKNAEAHKAIATVLAALLGPQAAALAVVKAAIDALQSMNENSPWLTLFERESRSGRSARFQVATADVDATGLLQVALAAFSLVAKSTVTQVLFFKFASSSTKLEYAAGKATIYEAALASQRDAIAARLAAYRAAYVAEIALPPLPPSRPARAGVPMAAPRAARPVSPARLTRALLLE